MTDRTTVTLNSDHWQLVLEPDLGVQWLAGRVKPDGANNWTDVVPDCLPATSELAAANFHMIPYSNRIRDGHFTFDDEMINLADSEHHAIHGALRKQRWEIVAETATSLTCQFDTDSVESINWPWSMKAVIRYVLDGAVLHSRIDITNQDTTDMPVGTGWHPYFLRNILGAGPILTLPVSHVFPDANGNCLPDGPPIALPLELDFRDPKRLDANQYIDCCLAGLAGDIHITWPHAGINLIMQASENCQYLVFFNPDAPHFAVEPVTNANDAFNLHASGIPAGCSRLLPGDTFTTRLMITVGTP